ncbi:hypothetical protein [uncultured Mucilaginibacter sp.]|uniref:hypothetical protein n=1 Tax=uncultured Mucilaginibacter sp. TaxID=797541 RepID=UPI0025F2F85E|nr:hypothetical protein [uncultured Mucilaginibacter sp.]
MAKILDLKKKDAKVIVCFYEPCYGAVFPVGKDSCNVYNIKYLLWCINNKCFMQRFDDCWDYRPIDIGPTLMTFLQSNYLVIREEKLANLKYRAIIDGKDSIQEIYGIDHSCHYIFEVYFGNHQSTIDINDFVLEKTDYEGHRNLNYEINQKSMQNKLKNLAETQVAKYNQNLSDKKPVNK